MLSKIIKIILKIIKWFFIVLGSLIILWLIFISIKLTFFNSAPVNKETSFNKYFEENDPKNWEVKKGEWILSATTKKYYRHGEKRNKVTGTISTCGDNTDMFKSYRTKSIYQLDPVVYIGEWEYDQQIKKYIRLIKRQGLNDGEISSTYETQDELNRNIPSMKWRLVRKINDSFNFDNNPVEDLEKLDKSDNDKVVERLIAEGYFIPNGRTSAEYQEWKKKYGKNALEEIEPAELDKLEKLHPRQR